MDFHGIWAARMQSAFAKIVELIWVVVIYLTSELAIWGLSRVMAPAGIQFFASILGMIILFSIMTSLYLWRRNRDKIYQRWMKSKVCTCYTSTDPFRGHIQHEVTYSYLRSNSSTRI